MVNKKQVNKRVLFLITMLFLVLPLINATWYNPDWKKRISVNITEITGNTLYNFTTPIFIEWTAGMKDDFSDLIAVDNDNQPLNYWIEDGYINNTNATIWVFLPQLVGSSVHLIYIYYNNSNQYGNGNISNTFLFGDDFNDNFLNGVKWTGGVGNWTEESEKMKCNDPVGDTWIYFGSLNISNATIEWSSTSDQDINKFQAVGSRVDPISKFNTYYLGGAGYADKKLMIYQNFGTFSINETGTATTTYTSGIYNRFRFKFNGDYLSLTYLDDGENIQGTDSNYIDGFIALISYGKTYYDWFGVRTYSSSDPSIEIFNEENYTISPIELVIELISPTPNYTSNISSITFNCSTICTNLLNLTLVINGSDNITITNSTSNQTSLSLQQSYNLLDGFYTWGCKGYSQDVSNSSYRSFTINTTIPPIPPIPPTPPIETSTIYEILSSSGAGIGIFFQILTIALPLLLIPIAIIGVIVMIGYAIANAIKIKLHK